MHSLSSLLFKIILFSGFPISEICFAYPNIYKTRAVLFHSAPPNEMIWFKAMKGNN